MPHIRVRDIEVFYQQSGSGPDVVLIHAFTSNLAIWMMTDIVGRLSDRFRVTLYDMRGHGLTSATPTGYRSADLAQDLIDLQRELDLQPAFLVGHSLGGVVGMHAARLAPDNVRGLIVCDSFFPGLSHLEPNMPHSEPWKDLSATFNAQGFQLDESVNFGQLFRLVANLTEEQRKRLEEGLGPAGGRWLAQMGKLAPTQAGIESFEVSGLTEEEIRNIGQPAVALYDEFTPFVSTRDFLIRELPDCCGDVVPQAKHLAPVENSAAFVSIIERHLCRLAGVCEAS